MGDILTSQLHEIAEVSSAVAKGSFWKKMQMPGVQGEMLEVKNTMNSMIDQMNLFASEVLRVSWEVGIAGNLEGQAMGRVMTGTWKDMTDNINMMVANFSSMNGIVLNLSLLT